jgi:hypothetical protein
MDGYLLSVSIAEMDAPETRRRWRDLAAHKQRGTPVRAALVAATAATTGRKEIRSCGVTPLCP